MMRIGHGYDVHRFAENRKLILGGVEIPYEQGLLGHVDGVKLSGAHKGVHTLGGQLTKLIIVGRERIMYFLGITVG